MIFCHLMNFFFEKFFQEYQVSNSLYLDLDRCYVGPDLSLITVCKVYKQTTLASKELSLCWLLYF